MALTDEDLDDGLDAAEVDDGPLADDFEAEPEEPRDEPKEAPSVEDDVSALRDEHETKIANAQSNAEKWAEEAKSREAKLAEARAARVKAETAFLMQESEEAANAKIAAEDAYIEAKAAVDEAKKAVSAWKDNEKELRSTATPEALAARAWVNRTERYNNDATFRAEADKVYSELTRAGHDPRKKAFFDELDKRLNRKRPMANQSKTSGAPVTRGREPVRAAPKQDKLSEKETKWMREYGLDPSNKRHLDRWQREKRIMAEEGRAH